MHDNVHDDGGTMEQLGNPLLTNMSADLMLAGDAGDQFPKLFYSTLDNNRQVRATSDCLNVSFELHDM